MLTYINGYTVLDDGTILGKKGSPLSLTKNPNGYLSVCLNNKRRLVHKVIYNFFYGEVPKGLVIDHIDGDRRNNNYKNLQAITQAENVRKGKSTTLTTADLMMIRRVLKDRGMTQRALAKLLGVSPQLICDIKKGRAWNETALPE